MARNIKTLLMLVVMLMATFLFAQSQTIQYQYDNLNRLTRVDYSNGTVIQFTYDAIGNRTGQVITGNSQTAPLINSFQPVSGAIGSEVVVSGNYFSVTTHVGFNGISASLVVDSNTQLRATVPNGATTGKITVTTPNGIATSSTNFTVIAGNQTPAIRTPINPIVFGGAALNGSKTMTTVIYNDGTANLQIQSVNRSSGSDEFTVVTTFPLQIAPHDSQQVLVRFNPLTAGSKTATFDLIHNDTNQPHTQFNVAGIGGIDQPFGFPLTIEAETMDGTGIQVTGGRNLSGSPGNFWFIFQRVSIPKQGMIRVDIIARAEGQANGIWPKLGITGGPAIEINSTAWNTYTFTKAVSQGDWSYELKLNEDTRDGFSILIDRSIINLTEFQPVLHVDPTLLDFGYSETSLSFTITNAGDGVLDWSASCSTNPQSWWIQGFSPSSSGKNNATVQVSIDRAGFSPGKYEEFISIKSKGGKLDVTVRMEVPSAVFSFPSQGWYMVSLPMIPPDSSVTALFPKALGGIGYTWNSTVDAYDVSTIIRPTKGYWIAISDTFTSSIIGIPLESYTVHVPSQCWQMIGSISGGANFADPNDNPVGMVLSPAFGWNSAVGGYVQTATLNEKEGYWVAVFGECDLTVGGNGGGFAKSIAKTEWNTFYKTKSHFPPPPPNLDWKTGKLLVSAPKQFNLYQNYPNPFNPSTTICFDLPAECRVEMVVYNILGRKVATLVDKAIPAGANTVQWNGLNDNGTSMPSGLYLCRIKAGEFQGIRKLVLMR